MQVDIILERSVIAVNQTSACMFYMYSCVIFSQVGHAMLYSFLKINKHFKITIKLISNLRSVSQFSLL